NFQPGILSLPSISTRNLSCNASRRSYALSRTPSLCWAIGMIMACVGAIFGGMTSPRLSPCTMMSAPMIRVDMPQDVRSEEHTSELQSRFDLVCRLLLEKKNNQLH